MTDHGESSAGEVVHEPWYEGLYDPQRTCPKCGGKDVGTMYRPDGHAYACRDHRHRDFTVEDDCCKDEHFDRTCRRCHYEWREEVL